MENKTCSAETTKRKRNKPLIEKRRRARINECLRKLQEMVTDVKGNQSSRSHRLEKADVLEMTVDYIRHMSEWNRPPEGVAYQDQTSRRESLDNPRESPASTLGKDIHGKQQTAYESGFRQCFKEVCSYIKSQSTSLNSRNTDTFLGQCRSALLLASQQNGFPHEIDFADQIMSDKSGQEGTPINSKRKKSNNHQTQTTQDITHDNNDTQFPDSTIAVTPTSGMNSSNSLDFNDENYSRIDSQTQISHERSRNEFPVYMNAVTPSHYGMSSPNTLVPNDEYYSGIDSQHQIVHERSRNELPISMNAVTPSNCGMSLSNTLDSNDEYYSGIDSQNQISHERCRNDLPISRDVADLAASSDVLQNKTRHQSDNANVSLSGDDNNIICKETEQTSRSPSSLNHHRPQSHINETCSMFSPPLTTPKTLDQRMGCVKSCPTSGVDNNNCKETKLTKFPCHDPTQSHINDNSIISQSNHDCWHQGSHSPKSTKATQTSESPHHDPNPTRGNTKSMESSVPHHPRISTPCFVLQRHDSYELTPPRHQHPTSSQIMHQPLKEKCMPFPWVEGQIWIMVDQKELNRNSQMFNQSNYGNAKHSKNSISDNQDSQNIDMSSEKENAKTKYSLGNFCIRGLSRSDVKSGVSHEIDHSDDFGQQGIYNNDSSHTQSGTMYSVDLKDSMVVDISCSPQHSDSEPRQCIDRSSSIEQDIVSTTTPLDLSYNYNNHGCYNKNNNNNNSYNNRDFLSTKMHTKSVNMARCQSISIPSQLEGHGTLNGHPRTTTIVAHPEINTSPTNIIESTSQPPDSCSHFHFHCLKGRHTNQSLGNTQHSCNRENHYNMNDSFMKAHHPQGAALASNTMNTSLIDFTTPSSNLLVIPRESNSSFQNACFACTETQTEPNSTEMQTGSLSNIQPSGQVWRPW